MKDTATLPSRFIQKTLYDLPVGVPVWTVPWSLSVDEDRNCWIDAHTIWDNGPMGTLTMKVTRESDGFHVDISRTDYRWTPKAGPHIGDPVKSLVY